MIYTKIKRILSYKSYISIKIIRERKIFVYDYVYESGYKPYYNNFNKSVIKFKYKCCRAVVGVNRTVMISPQDCD